MLKYLITTLAFVLLLVSCKKEVKIVCDIEFNSPANSQTFSSGDTIKINVAYNSTPGNVGDSLNLFINSFQETIFVKEEGDNYEYDFVPVVTDGTIDTIRLEAVPGRANSAVCRESITIYVQP